MRNRWLRHSISNLIFVGYKVTEAGREGGKEDRKGGEG